MDEIVKLHDKIKNSPYWIGFEQEYARELSHDFYELTSLIYEHHETCGKYVQNEEDFKTLYKTKWGSILQPYLHDVRAHSLSIRLGLDPGAEYFGRVISYLQEFLTYIHQSIMDVEPEIRNRHKKHGFSTYDKVEYIEGEGWYRYTEVARKDKEKLIEIYKDLLKKFEDDRFYKQFFTKTLRRLEEENELYFKIV